MNALDAALGVLLAMLALDLFLTFGVIRRLREHTTRLAALEHPGLPSGLAVGAPVADFDATATGGTALSTATLHDAITVVSFVATECHACEDQLPTIRTRLDAAMAGGAQAMTVVVNVRGDREVTDKLLAGVDGCGAVIEEPLGGSMQAAFQVSRYPSFFLVGPDATVMATPGAAEELPVVALQTAGVSGP